MSTYSLADNIIRVLTLYLPAMITNASPVLTNLISSKHPIDGGRNFIDNRRLFGDGKTWEGFIIGLVSGLITGISYTVLFKSLLWVSYCLIMSVGALIGDIVNAFIKRRLNLPKGAPFLPFDQIDYMLGAHILVKALSIDNAINNTLQLSDLLTAITLSLILHPLTNYAAYLLKLKEVPW